MSRRDRCPHRPRPDRARICFDAGRSRPLDYSRRLWIRLILDRHVSCFSMRRSSRLIAFSFNDSRRNIVWRGFTLKVLRKSAGTTTGLIEAFVNSLTIAFVSTIDQRYPRRRWWPSCSGASGFPARRPTKGVVMLADRRPGNLHGRCDAGLLLARIGWYPTGLPWPLQPWQHHHRPHLFQLSVRRRCRSRPAGRVQPRTGGSRQGFGCQSSGRPFAT